MRKIKFNYAPETKLKVLATFERKLEILEMDIDSLKRNIPCYIRIEPDVKESVEVFEINIFHFKEKITRAKSTIALMKKDICNIRRTQEEFKALKKDLALLTTTLNEIETQLEFNSTIFFGSDFYKSYFGEGGFYEKEAEQERIKAEEEKKNIARRQRNFAKWLAGDED
jgi:hypothetical protein